MNKPKNCFNRLLPDASAQQVRQSFEGLFISVSQPPSPLPATNEGHVRVVAKQRLRALSAEVAGNG